MDHNRSARHKQGQAALQAALVAMTAYTLAIILLEAVIGISFESNDDVAAMMIAHGFGIAATPSALLPFSNVLQGYFVQWLGWPFGMAGYSVHLMGALVVAGAAAVGWLTLLNGRPWTNGLLVGALLLRPMVQPQFTIIAGFLAAAAALGLLAHARDGLRRHLLLAAGLALVAFLMRSQSLILVMLIAMPLLLRGRLLRDPAAWAVGAAALALMVAATWWDQRQLAAPEWQAFLTLDRLRGVFTDFGMANAVAARPDVMQAVGWSTNDLALLQHFWLVDPDMTHPDRLREAIAAVGVGATFQMDGARFLRALAQIAAQDLWAAWLVLGVAMSMLRGQALARAAMGLLLLMGVLILLSASGRFDIGRVYYPAMGALALLCLGMAAPSAGGRGWRPLALPAVALGAAALTLTLLLPTARARDALAAELKPRLGAIEAARPLVVWGSVLPFEALYPPLAQRERLPPLVIFGIGVTSLAPYGLAHWGGSIDGFMRRFASEEGLSLFAWGGGIALLEIYCQERFGGILRQQAVQQIGWRRHAEVSCLPAGQTPFGWTGANPAAMSADRTGQR